MLDRELPYQGPPKPGEVARGGASEKSSKQKGRDQVMVRRGNAGLTRISGSGGPGSDGQGAAAAAAGPPQLIKLEQPIPSQQKLTRYLHSPKQMTIPNASSLAHAIIFIMISSID